jgi:hypothetical protein
MSAISCVDILAQKVSIVLSVLLKKILCSSFSILQSLIWFDTTFVLLIGA